VLAVSRAPLPTAASEERVSGADLRILTLSELMRERSDALEAAHALYTACRLDQPTLGRVSEWPFADWRAFYLEDPEGIPDAYFLGLDADVLVGNCSVRRDGKEEDALRVGITGVLPPWRRHGLGLALKLRTHAYARANGYREIRTSNTRPNTAMLALNEKLGYAIVGSLGGYELALAT
jgi:GNAT superfamily N-acetyltransferase